MHINWRCSRRRQNVNRLAFLLLQITIPARSTLSSSPYSISSQYTFLFISLYHSSGPLSPMLLTSRYADGCRASLRPTSLKRSLGHGRLSHKAETKSDLQAPLTLFLDSVMRGPTLRSSDVCLNLHRLDARRRTSAWSSSLWWGKTIGDPRCVQGDSQANGTAMPITILMHRPGYLIFLTHMNKENKEHKQTNRKFFH